ncbi:tetratricopeptide repeat protein [Stappia sp. F7233]|uniref:Tetratricopeptide repeat protein n=1 Tax=Stappia albiluteola TaxID=2758565 RepID=A0A839AFC4_9HYPH|nr:tetratricopeptide repeat protein [Stappia albiluteola]MBA5777644.1 tetratricopeptide repeat protein [Stappia albiluteola]
MTRADLFAFLRLPPARRTARRALRRRAALAALGVALTFASPASAEAPATTIGTAEGLPITLSGSYLAGRLAGQSRDLANAAAFFGEALDADPGNAFLLDRTFVLQLANGNITAGLDLAERLTANQTDHFLARLVLAADAMRMDDYARAVTLVDNGARGPLAELTSRLISAWALQAQGETDLALERIATLEGPDWFDVFKTYHTALIQDIAGRHEAALDNFASAYGIDQGALRVIEAFARAKARSGDKAGALAVLDDYQKVIPDHPVIVATRRDIESGKALALSATDPDQGAAEVLYGLGAAIGRDGGEELAATFLQLALYLDPKADTGYVALASLFQRMGDANRAIETLKQVSDSSPLKRDAEIQIGLNYNSLDDLERSRSHLSALIESDPSDLEAVTALGNILRAHKLFEDADAVYSRGIATVEANPRDQDWTLYYYRGIARERTKRWPEAEADFRQALKISPEQPLVMNYLGYSLVDQGLQLNEALDMIRRAVQLRPQDGYIVDSLGWAYYRLGRYAEAVTQLEKAVQLRPEDPVINDHLGDAYWQVGRRLEARFQWNHARDLKPDEEELPKILEKIANGLSDDKTKNGAVEPAAKKNGG